MKDKDRVGLRFYSIRLNKTEMRNWRRAERIELLWLAWWSKVVGEKGFLTMRSDNTILDTAFRGTGRAVHIYPTTITINIIITITTKIHEKKKPQTTAATKLNKIIKESCTKKLRKWRDRGTFNSKRKALCDFIKFWSCNCLQVDKTSKKKNTQSLSIFK